MAIVTTPRPRASPVARVPFRASGARRCATRWPSSGVAVIALLVVLAVFGPWIAPYPGRGDRAQIDVPERLSCRPASRTSSAPTSWAATCSRRVILGARPALVVSLLVVGLAMLIGVPLGAIAGYRRGRIDGLIMRTTDLFLAFPPLLLAMAIVAALGPGLEHAALALAISWWPWYARIARAHRRCRCASSRSSTRRGPSACGDADRSSRRHIVPNSLAPDRGPGDGGHRHRHPRRRLARVHRPGRAAAHARLGPDGRRGPDRASSTSGGWPPSRASPSSSTVLAFNLVGDVLLRVLDPRQGR